MINLKEFQFWVSPLGLFSQKYFPSNYGIIGADKKLLKKDLKTHLTRLKNAGATGSAMLSQTGWKSGDNINWEQAKPEETWAPFELIDGKFHVHRLNPYYFDALREMRDVFEDTKMNMWFKPFDHCQNTEMIRAGATWGFNYNNHNGVTHFFDNFEIWLPYLNELSDIFRDKSFVRVDVNEPPNTNVAPWWSKWFDFWKNQGFDPSQMTWSNLVDRAQPNIEFINQAIYDAFGEEDENKIVGRGKFGAPFVGHGGANGQVDSICSFNPVPLAPTSPDGKRHPEHGNPIICPTCGKWVQKGIPHFNFKWGDTLAYALLWWFNDSAAVRAAKQRFIFSDDGGQIRDLAWWMIKFLDYFFVNHRWRRPDAPGHPWGGHIDFELEFCWDASFFQYPDDPNRNIYKVTEEISETLVKYVSLPHFRNTQIYTPEPDPIIPPEPEPNPEPIKHDLSAWYWINMKSKGLGIKEWWRALTGKGPRWCKEHHCPEDKYKEK